MKIKFLIIVLALFIGNCINASADITQGSLSSIISQVASSSSFTPSDQNTAQIKNEIQLDKIPNHISKLIFSIISTKLFLGEKWIK